MSKLQTDDSSLEWEILRWAAGADVALPYEPIPDERRLMERVVTHRLGPRLLRRLKTQDAHPSWCSEWVWAHLRGQNAKTVAQIEMRFRALREICAAVPEAPLLLKGFAPYAATGDAKFLRPSGDLDLLAPAAEPFCDALRSLGYGIVAASAAAHEFATAGRGSVGIEIHRFFPVYSFPPGVENAELEPHQFSSVHFQTFAAPPRREIYHDDIVSHAVIAQAPELAGLRVPDVTTTAFILCAHEFRELIHSPFEAPVPVRLALLADVYDLALHPDFDARRFLDLARLWGDDSARVIGHFLQLVFGSNPLPCSALDASIRYLPRQIGVRGIWASVGTAREWLMGLEQNDTLQRLQSRPSQPHREERPFHVASPSVDETCSVQPFVHHLHGEPLRLRLEMCRMSDQICLQLHLPPLVESHLEHKVRMDSASGCLSTVILFASGRWEQNGRECAVCQSRSGGASVRWELKLLDEPLFISVSRRDTNVHNFYNAQCVVALLVPSASITTPSSISITSDPEQWDMLNIQTHS